MYFCLVAEFRSHSASGLLDLYFTILIYFIRIPVLGQLTKY